MNDRGGYFKQRRATFSDGSTHWQAKYWRKKRKFSQYEATVDLVERAAFADYEKTAREGTIHITRGHVIASVRGYAKRWGWEQTAVHRFLKRLESDGELQAVTATPLGTLYRLTWYELDQGDATPDATANATPAQHLRNNNKKGIREETSLTGETGSLKPQRPAYPPEFERTWAIYPPREGSNDKRAAYRAWEARRKAGIAPDEMHAGTERFRAYHEAKDSVGTSYVMQGSRFYSTSEQFREPWTVSPSGSTPRELVPVTEVPGARSPRDAAWLRQHGY